MDRAVPQLAAGLGRPLRLLLLRRDWGSWLTRALGAGLAAYLAWYYLGGASPWLRTAVTDLAYLPLSLAAVALGWRAATRPALGRRARLAWALLTVSFGCQLAANLVWAWLELLRHQNPFPSQADVGYLGFIPVMLVALFTFPVRRRSRPERFKLALDIGTVVAGSFMVLWYLVLGPIVAEGGTSRLAVAVSVAYPVGDLVLLFGIAAVLLRGTGESTRHPLRILIAGLIAFVVADVYYGYVGLHQQFVGGSWPDLFWLTGNWLFAVAANDQRHRAAAATGQEQEARRPRRLHLLPYLGVALGYGLLLYIARGQRLYPLGGLLLGGVVLTGLVVVRQLTALRENAELARNYQRLSVTDSLTGLGNRRHFFDLAEREFGRAVRYGRQLALVMIDVDHFKQINDLHGHAAGDLVLRTVTDRCWQALRGNDVLCRLGGDELVALLPETDAHGALAAAERLREAVVPDPIRIGETTLSVTLSLGVADATGCPDLPLLVHRADAALYEAKRRGRDQAAVWAEAAT